MVRFFFKKWFYDTWDSMYVIAGFNIAAIALAAAGVLLPARLESQALRVLCAAIAALAGGVWCSAASRVFCRIADFKAASWSDVREALPPALIPGLQFGAIAAAMVVVASVALPFYASMGGVLGSFMAGLIFWALASIALALQYFLPIRSARDAGFAQSLRLSFVVFVDGPFFSIALALWGIACVVLSPLVAFLLPGPAAAVLAACEGSRLRLYKVDRLMASGGRPLGRCDWAGLLADDKEALGDRKLKDFLFPWKR